MPQGTFIGAAVFTADAPPVTPASAGCWIDASALSSYDLNTQVVRVALAFGARFFVDTDQKRWDEYGSKPHEITVDEDLFMASLADDALDWLNDEVVKDRPLAFMIEDNSLYLEIMTDEESLGTDGYYPN